MLKSLFCSLLTGILMLFQVQGGITAFNTSCPQESAYNAELATYLFNNCSQNADIIDTDKYELFVSGEHHATQKNFDVEMNIIKNLSEKSNLKYIIAETSMTHALLINNYLKTGNIENLNIVMNSLKGTFSGSNENYKFLQDLYEFNKTLPEDKKLTYLGMDIEHQYNLAIGYLWDIDLRKGPFEKLEKFINDCKQGESDEEKLLSLETIYKDVNENAQLYSEKLGDEFWTFEYLIRNTINGIKCYVMDSKGEHLNSNIFRERAITENFYKIYEHFPKGKYYGQWGLEHTFLNNVKTDNHPDYEQRIATALNTREDSPIKNKVYSMAIVYVDSFFMNPNNPKHPNKICMVNSKNEDKADSNTLEFCAQDKIQFFKLDAQDSPFSKKLYLLNNITKTGCTTDYFKGLVLVKNSSACTYLGQ